EVGVSRDGRWRETVVERRRVVTLTTRDAECRRRSGPTRRGGVAHAETLGELCKATRDACTSGLASETPHRNTPVWPSENRPGWGYTHSPCGPCPTGMRARSCPVDVSIAYTSLFDRPLNHSVVPSADTPPMSGLPPPGIVHLARTARVVRSTTDTVPSSRFDT